MTSTDSNVVATYETKSKRSHMHVDDVKTELAEFVSAFVDELEKTGPQFQKKGRTKKLSQPEDIMFERNLALLVAKEREVELVSSYDVYRGMVSGVDEKFIQLCLTDEKVFMLFNRDHVISIVESGNALDDVDEEDQTIRNMIANFQEVCKYHNENRRHKA